MITQLALFLFNFQNDSSVLFELVVEVDFPGGALLFDARGTHFVDFFVHGNCTFVFNWLCNAFEITPICLGLLVLKHIKLMDGDRRGIHPLWGQSDGHAIVNVAKFLITRGQWLDLLIDRDRTNAINGLPAPLRSDQQFDVLVNAFLGV